MNIPFAEQEYCTNAVRGLGRGFILPQITRPSQVLLACLLITLLGAIPKELPALGAEDPKDLSKEQQEQLKRRAIELNEQGVQLYRQGRYVAATKRVEEALAVFHRLYPKTKFPKGHPVLATVLNNLGFMLRHQGKYTRARGYFEQALAMYEQLYPKEQYPQGHRLLAMSLNNLGGLLNDQGEYGRAREYVQQALAMYQRLYPKTKFPKGHPDLAQTLDNLGAQLNDQGEYAHARNYFQQALAMLERLYPKAQYPQGHPSLANCLNNLGYMLQAQGEYALAIDYFQQSLAMRQRLYPKDKFPPGHTDLAQSLNNLGFTLQHQGDYARARDYYQQALAMYERLFPKTKYRPGHPRLANCLDTLGTLMQVQGEYARAREYYQQALAMCQRLYPQEKYPRGHPQLGRSLANLGCLLLAQGEYGRARDYYQQALAMDERLYLKERFPQGHRDLASSLNNLGMVLYYQGEYARARDYVQQALAMRERIYPKDKYPHGHPDLASSLTNLGGVFQAQRESARALDYLQRALAMRQDLCDLFGTAASEAEAFSLAASLPLTLDGLLSVSRDLTGTDRASYAALWRSKAAITRLLEGRRQELLRMLSSPELSASKRKEIRATWAQLRDKQRALSRLLLAPARDSNAHRNRLQQLSQDKANLEQQLAKLLPDFARRQALLRKGHEDLVKKLPGGTVFIDFLRYVRFEQDPKRPGKKGEQRTPCYVAFVLRRAQPVWRVELNQAVAIDQAMADWRSAIKEQRGSAAAQKLRRLLWTPLARHIPKDCKTLLLAPDSVLTQLPWPALPTRKEGRVLLEDYAVAVVPHGPYLLEQLTSPTEPEKEKGLLLAVGAVQYDARPQAPEKKTVVALKRAAEWGDRKDLWRELPGAAKELDKVCHLAGKRPVLRLTGNQAGTARLLAELPEARYVHLATHGFFADKKFRSILQVDEKLFDRRSFRKGPPPGVRNPLVLSGLVLAGANLPLPKDLKERSESDGGILTAETITGLPLHKLELAVLSACETGLGEVAGGEGVFGLQRAFHLAGARNVVASLWKVDDQATSALMALFYDKLWRQKKPAIEALREAQLTLYHHPERIAALAKERGPNFDKVVRLPLTPDKETKPSLKGKAAIKLWAGFVLSGLGQ
jgi:tetratricopeptide (TPR) repeat protein